MQIYTDEVYVRIGALTPYRNILKGWIQSFEWRENKKPVLMYLGFPADCEVERDQYCMFNATDSVFVKLCIIMLSADDEDLNWGALICPDKPNQWLRIEL